MGILRLGKPNSKIVDEIKRRHEQPVVKRLKMTATNGNVCEFDYSDTTSCLIFTYGNNLEIQYPYNLCSDLNGKDLLKSVDDTGNKILQIGIGHSRSGFYNCGQLNSVNVNAATQIKNQAFSYSTLENINCSSVLSIEPSAFLHTNVKELYCPYLKFIGDNAFNQCYKLSSIVISNMLKDDITELGGTKAFGAKRNWPVSVYVPLSCIDDLLLNNTWDGLVQLSTIELVGV